MITLRVFGCPKGQPRVKAFRKGNHAGVYTPSTADAWKLAICDAFRATGPGQAWLGPVSLTARFLFPRPARLNTKKATCWDVAHTGRPDIDNCIKSLLDALTMVGAWHDDAQVAWIKASKHYAAAGEAPGAEITIEEVEA